jgi:hypothetical protein
MRLLDKILIYFSLATFVAGEPYLAPNDPFIRHETRLLADEGKLSGLQNTWPLDLGGIAGMNSGSSYQLPHNLLGNKISEESDSGWSNFSTYLGFADDRSTARGFSPKPRSSFVTNGSISWMNDRFAGKLSLNAFYGMQKDWKGREDEGFAIDGSYLAARLGNWSASFGQVDRWWGPAWDGSLILSSNARPIPAIAIDRRVPEPFENKWLSWLGPWSAHSFIGRLEKERTVANPYLWGMRGEIRPTIVNGLEIGFFRMIQLGGEGRPEGFGTWADAFLSQDNYGGNTGKNDRSQEPGNQLAGIDLRWQMFDAPIALYGQVVGEDEDKFLPNALMFQYGIEIWKKLSDSTIRLFLEYADLTTHWWTDRDYSENSPYNISYNHHIYNDGYRYHGRPIGHWADQDSRILSFGGLLLRNNGIGWGFTGRNGDLNEDGAGQSSVSNGIAGSYSSFDIYNSREYQTYDLSINTSIGWESIKPSNKSRDDGLTAFVGITRNF